MSSNSFKSLDLFFMIIMSAFLASGTTETSLFVKTPPLKKILSNLIPDFHQKQPFSNRDRAKLPKMMNILVKNNQFRFNFEKKNSRLQKNPEYLNQKWSFSYTKSTEIGRNQVIFIKIAHDSEITQNWPEIYSKLTRN